MQPDTHFAHFERTTDPWHQRSPVTEHYQWFRNLVELHELTKAWLTEVQIDRPSYFLTRGFSRRVGENLWMLESLSEKKMEDFLDDTHPNDMLARLDHAVWAVQAWTLTHFQIHCPPGDRESLSSLFEQLSWKAGRKCAQTRWKNLISTRPNPSLDLKTILLALHDSPFAGYPQKNPFLIQRALTQEITLELFCCPHQQKYHEVGVVADRLCELHWHWLRGYAYGLNSKTSGELKKSSPRCIQHWYFL